MQNVIWPDEVCGIRDMYFRTDGFVNQYAGCIELKPGEQLSTNTYMNCLDINHWRQYTTIEQFALQIEAEGTLCCDVVLRGFEGEEVLFSRDYHLSSRETVRFSLDTKAYTGILYFVVKAVSDVRFYSGRYETEREVDKKICLAVNICTYHRNLQLENNLRILEESWFFDRNSPLFGKMKIYITDNGDDFTREHENEYICISRNSNRGGGTGGFTKGLEMIRKDLGYFKSTHTVFMDDDVEFQTEGFYRLFAFLSFLREEYAGHPVAGRMFRMDNRQIQYTAAENWNGGNLTHSGWNLDMTLPENVTSETLTGEYGGWWLCVYPNSIALTQKPFPFFIHCDDVEYGLRTDCAVLLIRGFQVWHETYEYRMTDRVFYYDLRNPMVVNTMQGIYHEADDLLIPWKQRLDKYHNEGKYKEKYLCALALWHFAKEKIFSERLGQIPEYQMKICDRQWILRLVTPVLHRNAEKYTRKHYLRIIENYQKKREESIWH